MYGMVWTGEVDCAGEMASNGFTGDAVVYRVARSSTN